MAHNNLEFFVGDVDVLFRLTVRDKLTRKPKNLESSTVTAIFVKPNGTQLSAISADKVDAVNGQVEFRSGAILDEKDFWSVFLRIVEGTQERRTFPLTFMVLPNE